MNKFRLPAIALAIFALLLASGCKQSREKGQNTGATPKPFKQWSQDLGPLAMPQWSVDGSNNWYFPATLTNLDMKKAAWVRDFSTIGEKRFVAGGGKVFYFGSRGFVGALDAATGQTAWENAPKPLGAEESFSPLSLVLTKYALVVAAKRGTSHFEICFYDPANGELERTEEISFEPIYLSVTDGIIFAMGADGEVEAYAQETGAPVASARQVTSLIDFAASPGRLLLLGGEGAAFSLGTKDLKPAAVRLFNNSVVSPFVTGGKLIVFGRDIAEALVLDPQTLTTVARGTLDAQPNLLPAGNGSRIFFGQTDGRFRCYDTAAGKYVWTRDLESTCYIFTAFSNCVIAVADYTLASSDTRQPGQPQGPGQQAPQTRPRPTPSWFIPGSGRSYCIFLLSATDGSILFKSSGSGYFMPQAVVPEGILVREDPAGTLALYPADIKPLRVQAGSGAK
jgi:outer membrane protein assembly factor BamB